MAALEGRLIGSAVVSDQLDFYRFLYLSTFYPFPFNILYKFFLVPSLSIRHILIHIDAADY